MSTLFRGISIDSINNIYSLLDYKYIFVQEVLPLLENASRTFYEKQGLRQVSLVQRRRHTRKLTPCLDCYFEKTLKCGNEHKPYHLGYCVWVSEDQVNQVFKTSSWCE